MFSSSLDSSYVFLSAVFILTHTLKHVLLAQETVRTDVVSSLHCERLSSSLYIFSHTLTYLNKNCIKAASVID